MNHDSEALKAAPWYHEKITSINPNMRKILEERAVPPSEVLNHVQTVRDKAWVIFPYPCIGMFSFTHFPMTWHPLYDSIILPRLTNSNNPSTLLDLGCGFAQDFRSLISSGVNPAHLTGIDNHDGFINLGYELFRDRETLGTRFVVADMLDLSSMPEDMVASFDVIWAGASFHLFDWESQVKASIVAVKLLKDREGSAIYGYQVGHRKGQIFKNPKINSGSMWLHDPESFERLWKTVGEETGTRWKVASWMDLERVEDLRARDEGIMRQRFVVERVHGQPGFEV